MEAGKLTYTGNKALSCEISGSQGGENEDDCLLGCCAM
jgi:hypothetical protein